VYRPFKQSHFWIVNYYARTHDAVGRVVQDVKKTVMRDLASDGQPRGSFLAAQVDGQLQTVRTNATEIAGFAIVGLLLAITGLYGVLLYVVQQRTREIGIRGVLGAGRGRILGMVLSQAMLLSLAGVVVGIIAAIGTMRLMQGLLYGTPTRDIPVYAAVSAIALLVTLAASLIPAVRAAKVDPVIALRSS
jgi:ABC-type antimicrobial peptide transport system permease subunit